MERYELTNISSIGDTDHAGRIHQFLVNEGFDVQGVSVGTKGGEPCVWVTCDRDPTKTIETYTPTLTPEEQHRADVLADAAAVVAAITEKPRQSRTDTEKVLLGLAFATDAPVFAPSTPEEPIDGVWNPATGEEPIGR